MTVVVSTNLVIARVDTGKDGDFYDVHAWLRDTCIPACRPLYNELDNLYDDDLKAAALVKHNMSDGTTEYELIVHHGCMEKRFKCGVPRKAPKLPDFIRQIIQELP
jgi:hypothetical protein